MWQRIQTLFLGIATFLVASLFWCDVAESVGPGGAAEPIKYVEKTVYLIWLVILTVLQVLSLGGYRWRMRQMKVVLVTAFACLGFQGWLVYDYFQMRDGLVFSWTALFPFAASVLDFLAARNIMLDEAIVQSAGRLRSTRKKSHRV